MTYRMNHFLALGVILLASACGGSGGGAPPPIVVDGAGIERIDSAMNGVMNRHAPPGIAVAVVRNGKLVVANSYGSADLDSVEALRPDHLFRIASISKPVTGIAAIRAIEEGLLDLMGLEMVEVGESTGALEEMLEHVSTTYDELLDRQLSTAVSLLEPAVLVTMGVLLALILLSLYLPLFNVVQVI